MENIIFYQQENLEVMDFDRNNSKIPARAVIKPDDRDFKVLINKDISGSEKTKAMHSAIDKIATVCGKVADPSEIHYLPLKE